MPKSRSLLQKEKTQSMKNFIWKTKKFHCSVAKAYSRTNTAIVTGIPIKLLQPRWIVIIIIIMLYQLFSAEPLY